RFCAPSAGRFRPFVEARTRFVDRRAGESREAGGTQARPPVKRLEVRLRREPGQERLVGRLAETGPRSAGGQLVFEYDSAFLADPLWLSPFKLPPQAGLIEHRDHAFGPIFGLFDDSLPDGWG